MLRYEAIESRRYVQAGTGRTASIYGAMPHGDGWTIEACGWTVRDNVRGTVGIGRKPWDNKADAQAWCDKFNK